MQTAEIDIAARPPPASIPPFCFLARKAGAVDPRTYTYLDILHPLRLASPGRAKW